jgi:hypothetical protein
MVTRMNITRTEDHTSSGGLSFWQRTGSLVGQNVYLPLLAERLLAAFW